jgi:hypothetical protein
MPFSAPRRIRDISYYGIGVRSFGCELEPPDGLILTRWVTLFFIPVIPFARVRCRYVDDSECPTLHGDRVFRFQLLERVPLSFASVFETYLVALVGIVIGVGPFGLMAWRRRGESRPDQLPACILGLADRPGVLAGSSAKTDVRVLVDNGQNRDGSQRAACGSRARTRVLASVARCPTIMLLDRGRRRPDPRHGTRPLDGMRLRVDQVYSGRVRVRAVRLHCAPRLATRALCPK